MASRYIGIELDGTYFTAVKVRQRWKRPCLESFFFCDLPEDMNRLEEWEKVQMSFQEWAGNWLGSTPIMAALPGDDGIPVRMLFPFRKFSKIEQVIKVQIEGHVPLTVDDSVVDFIPIGKKGEEGLEVIAIAAAKKTIRGQLERLAALNIVPTQLTYSPLTSIRTVLSLKPADRNQVLGIVHVGSGYASFSLCEGGVPSFIRTIHIHRPPDAESEMPGRGRTLDQDSLLRDLRFTLRACAQALGREVSIERIILSGGGADLNSLAVLLETGLGIPCQPIAWENGLSAPSGGAPSSKTVARVCCSIGAALLADKPFSKGFDLRREEFALSRGWRGLRRPIAAAVVAALLALGIGLADLSLKVRQAERRLDAAEAQVQAVLREVFPQGSQIISPGPQIASRVQDKTRRLNLLMGNPALGESALDVIARISAAIPPSLKIRLNQLSVDEGGVSLKGATLTFEAVDRVKNLLSEKAGFAKPEVKQARLQSDRKGVEFFIHIPMDGKRIVSQK